MKTHRSRYSVLTFAAAVVGLPFLGACTDQSAPPSGPRRELVGAFSLQGSNFVYPEEFPFWNLAQTVPSSAGFFLDPVSADVIVTVTNPSEGDAAKALLRSWLAGRLARARIKNPRADVVVRQASYTFLQLREWRDRMNQALTIPGVDWLDLDEVKNRVVLGIDPGVDPHTVRTLARQLGVPEQAVDFEVDGPVVPQALLTDSIRPIAGATKIAYDSAGSTFACTLGFPARLNGTRAFVTASHCSSKEFMVDSTHQYQPRRPLTHADSMSISPIGFEVADYAPQTCPPGVSGSCVWADAAVYQYTADSTQWILGRIARPTYGCYPGPCSPVNLQIGAYFAVTRTDSSILVNDLVSHIGIGTGWDQHLVSATCVNHTLNGIVVLCQDHATYGNGAGDSGGPVLFNINVLPDTTVVLGGVHWGATRKYGVFSPWSGIATEYPGLVVH
jgi:hypothetical protein